VKDKEGGEGRAVQTRIQTHLKLDRMVCHTKCLKSQQKNTAYAFI